MAFAPMALAALLPTASASYLPIIPPHVPQPLLRSSKPRCQVLNTAAPPLSILGHVGFWISSTLLTRQLLPTISNPPEKLTAHLDHSHEHFEPLSTGCWAAHLWAQAVASHVALHVLLPSADAARRALGLATLLSTFGGGFLLGSHALIAKDPFGEKLLYTIGTRIVRAATLVVGVGLVAPSHCAAACAALLALCATDRLTFASKGGQLLALLSLGMVVGTASLGTPYRAAYAAFFAGLPLLPSSKRDAGHSVVAVSLGLPTATLLLAR